MKKKNTLIVMILFLLFIPLKYVDAKASASISVSTSSTIVGNSGSATLTITSDDILGQIYGTFSCGGLGQQDLFYINNIDKNATVKKYTINWTAKSIGTYTCVVEGLTVGTLKRPEDGIYSVNATSKTINVVKASSSSSGSSKNPSTGGTTATKKEYSSDNTLKSLSIEGYNLEPVFNKDTLEYRLKVDQSVEKIKVNASANDDKASVKGTGEVSLSNGENTLEIKVTAENGNEKVYKIIVTAEDLNPIKVNLDDKEFTIVKKNNDLIQKLDYYEEVSIKINEEDIVAYENTKTKTTLVLLKDNDNNINYYVYDAKENTYKEYSYIKIGGVTLRLIDSNIVPKNYSKHTLELQDKKIDYYKMKESNKVGLIYGINEKTGNIGYYVYDAEEETLSKYYDEEIKVYESNLKKQRDYTIILAGVTVLILVLSLVLTIIISKNKNKNKYKFK